MSSKILTRTLKTLRLSQNMCTLTSKSKTPETQVQKLERIADEYLSLTKLERYDYNILFRHKMGLHNLRSAAAPSISPATGNPAVEDKKPAKEKVVFDVKLEKFDASSKIKVIKEVRGFTDLGLKEAKDLVEKVPVVVKKGITKDEADAIAEKLKAVGATVVLE